MTITTNRTTNHNNNDQQKEMINQRRPEEVINYVDGTSKKTYADGRTVISSPAF